ncbi:flagellar biosynthesis repressor FlbT [Stakelama sp. CBK3Z-3]|uniref:Flagellar biosynthesis repressor FlbT n=1 Tax=Stakelama flava TaxID=2860338 RepID=A0ABS6XJQ3_9SPHN|nr:flagellar biosynthesis repressor FlbT [Stakelama flava]MBW4330442.1 flagellar biosynthesis repressor FlbT [Stakelama flava]
MLRISLRDGEALIINGALLRASGRTDLIVENQAALLRGREIMTPEEADTPAKQLYFACMMAYIGEDSEKHRDSIIDALRLLMPTLDDIAAKAACVAFANHVAVGDYYKGLAQCRALIAHEQAANSNTVAA